MFLNQYFEDFSLNLLKMFLNMFVSVHWAYICFCPFTQTSRKHKPTGSITNRKQKYDLLVGRYPDQQELHINVIIKIILKTTLHDTLGYDVLMNISRETNNVHDFVQYPI